MMRRLSKSGSPATKRFIDVYTTVLSAKFGMKPLRPGRSK